MQANVLPVHLTSKNTKVFTVSDKFPSRGPSSVNQKEVVG